MKTVFERGGLWLLLLLAPLLLFPAPGWNWLLLLLPVFWLGRGLATGRMLERTPVDPPVLLLLVQTVISAAIVPDIEWSMGKIAGIAFGAALFFELTARLKGESSLRWAVAGFLGAGAGLGLVGLFNMAFVGGRDPSQADLLTRLGLHLPKLALQIPGAEEGFNPNAVAGTLTLVIPVLAALVIMALRKEAPADSFLARRGIKPAGMIVLALLLAVVVITYSRETWLALFLSVGLPLAAMAKSGRRRLISILTVIAGLAVLAGAFAVLVGHEGLPIDDAEITGKAVGRTQAWSVGLEAVRTHPWTGIGLNRVRLLPGIGVSRAHCHNHYIHTAAELGLPALAALIALLILMGAMGAEVWKRAPEAWMRYAGLGLGWGQLAHALFGLTDSIPLGAKAGIFFWASLALMTALFRYTVSKSAEARVPDVH